MVPLYQREKINISLYNKNLSIMHILIKNLYLIRSSSKRNATATEKV